MKDHQGTPQHVNQPQLQIDDRFWDLSFSQRMSEMGSEVPCPISRHHENCCRDCAPIVVLAAASATGEM
jgi:hypothetical protein